MPHGILTKLFSMYVSLIYLHVYEILDSTAKVTISLKMVIVDIQMPPICTLAQVPS